MRPGSRRSVAAAEPITMRVSPPEKNGFWSSIFNRSVMASRFEPHRRSSAGRRASSSGG